ncbi:sugar ABC transporter permease [Rhizobium sp. RU36D]|uniref:carbohydrate ABC transporter permease n=1 Tax=Rhizobium sp. RU36D TaxID=1907415 RepID=UPI0009D8E698|nr:sugar ABC transporter permease [Rhizobium sp. RU36D]SMD20103.1 carbohydrate ABC transporter membrane protein 1, CUT1 family [Rhizobium sp. RU36D]
MSTLVSVTRAKRPLVPISWAIPGIIFCLLFHYVAVLAGGWYAFTDWNGLSTPRFVGLDNFVEILGDSNSLGALINTLVLASAFVIGSNGIGLALAVALHRTLKLRFVLRSLFFAPVVMSPLAVSYIWQFILDARGPVNTLLAEMGLRSLQRVWLGDGTFALWSIALVMVWQFSGLCMAFYLAGLQSIPAELDEAAAVDGASAWKTFRRVTFPLLAPAATVSVSMTSVLGLRVFDQVMALTRGGPGHASETLATEIFKQTFVYGRFGYGSAFALILTALILVVSAVQIALLRAREKKFA